MAVCMVCNDGRGRRSRPHLSRHVPSACVPLAGDTPLGVGVRHHRSQVGGMAAARLAALRWNSWPGRLGEGVAALSGMAR